MYTRRKVVLILAFDHRQYREKARDLRERTDTPVACVYGDTPERMRGIDADKVITCDGFWERDDAIELAQQAQTRLRN